LDAEFRSKRTLRVTSSVVLTILVGTAFLVAIVHATFAAPPMVDYQQGSVYPPGMTSENTSGANPVYVGTPNPVYPSGTNPVYTSEMAPVYASGIDGCECGPFLGESSGTWQWMRSPDQERRMVAALYNRYCIRCHGVDGRGVWDIPDVPNFTNVRWQQCRSDAQLARIILEGRGACMPPFRGALSLEEAWAVARYLRTFVPGTEASRPDLELPPRPAAAIPPTPPALQRAPTPGAGKSM
jgi:mono/diheme cytochrome c family protein